jgi:Flp pilus assembly protein CpaB
MLRLRRPRSPVLALRRAAAGLLAVLAAVLAMRPGPAPAGATADAATVPVVVAARDLAPGSVLTGADLRVAAFPPGLAPHGGSSGPARVAGRVLAGAARAGEPLTDVRLVGAGLTALLAPGQVAAPVRPADLAVAALVRAGDRVDVLATPEGATEAQVVTEQALVLAAPSRPSGVDQRGGLGTDPAPGADAASGLLLLAVDAPTAARLAAAAAGATLTVSLNAP